MFSLILGKEEREKKGEWEEERERGERNIDLFPPEHALTRDEIFNLGMCPEIEPTTFWCVYEIMLQPTWASPPESWIPWVSYEDLFAEGAGVLYAA